ncbi:sulfotransferase domain-containing protein [Gimibacter soli]|uniref:Sulfotransferase domain-containing protein n=1 Tax=Gimibacter soli TaxID=3024400 RepID=A0AAE9XPP8_9PROT|nr:sulfotransferase domain-containing protein [Gimibacter soli]WCL53977.1 sulfotransferase domain-containing protein [Gimibacter soli]
MINRNLIRCVGTYHKAGTVWMRAVFSEIAARLGLDFVNTPTNAFNAVTPKPGTIYFQWDSRFSPAFDREDVRGFRIVRDPRDIVISGAHYHMKATEPWLQVKKDRFGGLSYQEMINSLDGLDARYRFEMENFSRGTIRSMTVSRGNRAMRDLIERRFLMVRYETLIEDVETTMFRSICDHLDLPFELCAPIFVENSLFGQSVRKDHVRSGKKEQWTDAFSRAFAREFAATHQRALEKLGYEENRDWIERCAERA